MKKSQRKEPQFSGEITAFLSLIFILMISVVGALVQSASIQMTKSINRADMQLALESVFAEYHREMLEEYDLFVHMGSEESTIESRLKYYGISNMNHSITKLELLSDRQGETFWEQAVRYMKNWLGMEEIETGNGSDFSSDSSLEKLEKQTEDSLLSALEQQEEGLLEDDNPLPNIQNIKKSGILSVVFTEEEVSNRNLEIEKLPSYRTLAKGNIQSEQNSGGTAEKILFVSYLLEHFSDVTEKDATKSLSYEIEYLLNGKASDRENLEDVCNQILKIRMASNYAYLLTDEGKKAEAGTLALGLCTLLTNPGIAEIVKQGILLAWAYGESIIDVRALLKGEKVPALKNAENWQLQLSNLAKLGKAEEFASEKRSETGLSYQDYLKGLLMLEENANLCMRGLDLMEANLQIKVDQCMTKVEIESTQVLQRGVKDTFLTTFGYQ